MTAHRCDTIIGQVRSYFERRTSKEPLDAKTFQHYCDVSRSAGNEPTPDQLALFRHVFVAETERQARALAESALNHYFRLFAPAAFPVDLEKMPVSDYPYYKEVLASFFGDRQPTFDEVCDSGFILCGDPDSVREQILEQFAATGAGRLLAQVHFGDMALEHVLRAEELLAAEVLPAVHDHSSELVG